MTVDEAGKPTVREPDVAFHDPEAKVDKNYSGPVLELKSWAYANQADVIQTAGGGAFADAASFQMQAYEIMVDEQGIPVFVINERGNIYARDSSKGTWFRADKSDARVFGIAPRPMAGLCHNICSANVRFIR